ncbi:MerR family transcriptional regulator [Paenibacillus sp. NPDC056579]|uniref:MerR family transcriptional regulator n=1 Tax=unclassified Paenibacillus TaxID=185978 RepID=UPI001EF97F95|nr:MerR family transcriptional regulator [Paenibacillus sp. H1-7]ULL13958.1 MerR family transcriptional regulator [Paenibacillus sp. H1-7]
MKISELSKRTGVSTRSIRHYEKKKIIKAMRLENDYREFDESAIERIRIIQLYLGLGLTTEQIEQILSCEDSGPDEYEFCKEMLDAYQGKLNQINQQIEALEAVKQRLEKQKAKMMEKRTVKAAEAAASTAT